MAFTIDKEQCAGCGVCASTCRFDAISEDDGKYIIAAAKCTDCGECSSACPVSCISGNAK